MTAGVDPKRRVFVAVGSGAVRMWDLTTWTYSEIITGGDSSIVSAPAPGFEYDPVIEKFVAWSGGADVYVLDMDTRTWTRRPPASTNSVVPTAVTASGGTFGRFRYIPSKNAYITVNSVFQNAYVYKLSAGGSPPALTVSPAGGLSTSGPVGGPFSPSSTTYTLSNPGTASLDWTAGAVRSWVTVSLTNGTLAAGTNATVAVSINSGADSLAYGTYTDTVTFTNATNGNGDTTRPIDLTVSANPPPTVTFPPPPSTSFSSPLQLSGTASSGVTVIMWTNAATGASGTAAGTATWAASIPLAPGINDITITAVDSQGGSSSQTFSVTYTPGGAPPGSKGGSSGGCGATGMETLLLLGLAGLLRGRKKR